MEFRLRLLILVYIMLYNNSFDRCSHFKSFGHTKMPYIRNYSPNSICIGGSVHWAYLLMENAAYFYDFSVDLNDIFLNAY